MADRFGNLIKGAIIKEAQENKPAPPAKKINDAIKPDEHEKSNAAAKADQLKKSADKDPAVAAKDAANKSASNNPNTDKVEKSTPNSNKPTTDKQPEKPQTGKSDDNPPEAKNDNTHSNNKEKSKIGANVAKTTSTAVNKTKDVVKKTTTSGKGAARDAYNTIMKRLAQS